MAKAEIIEDLGAGQYTIKRIWAGRADVQTKIDAYNAEIAKLQAEYDTMPTTTDEELFAKHVVGLQIKVFEKKVIYLTDNFPEDETVDAWCTDYTEGLTGEVGTIDIAGEKTTDVNIRPNGIASNVYSGARDGELYPGIALGPWTSLLNLMIYPGWQRFKPLHRYAWVLEDTIDYTANTCAVAIQPTFSLMNYNVNKAATGGGEEPAAGPKSSKITNFNVNLKHGMTFEEISLLRQGILETKAASEFFIQNAGMAHPGFLDFVDRNPDHPISNVTQLNSPIYITDEQYIQINRICKHIDYLFRYKSDQSGYAISDYWDVMYDIGDPWYWTPTYKGEPQQEFTFGNVALEYDDSGLVVGLPDDTLEEWEYYNFLYGTYTDRNLELEYATTLLPEIGPRQVRTGDCEDYVLTKMQAIIEAGIIPKENLQILLCYVVNAGYHAVLGIQTANRGFLISDQRDYGQLWEIEQLSRTHFWESFSIATAAGEASEVVKWAKSQFIIKDVPFEYMDCNADAFTGLDEVVVEFTGQDWDQPKVIGFKENPRLCSDSYIFPGYSFTIEPWPVHKYSYNSDSWVFKNGRSGQDTSNGVLEYGATGENGLGFMMCGVDIAAIDVAYGSARDDCYSWDSVSESWDTINDHPQDKAWLGCRSLKTGKIITTGGASFYGAGGLVTSHSVADTHEYTISFDSYTTKSSGDRADSFADFVIDEKFYKVNGQVTDLSGIRPDGYIRPASISTKSFNNFNNTWNVARTLDYQFKVLSGWNLNGKGFIGGGIQTVSSISLCAGDPGISIFPTTAAMFEYDSQTDTWENLGCGPRKDHSYAKSELLNESKCLWAGGGGSSAYYVYEPDSQSFVVRGSGIDILRDEIATYIAYSNGAEL